MSYPTPKSSRPRKSRIFNSRIIFVALAAFALLALATTTAFMSTGAIFTTDIGCGGVNINIFASKTDVYLNGGPAGGGSGLPDGSYYVQVTDPSGSNQLGVTSTASVTVSGGNFAGCYQLWPILVNPNDGNATGYDTTNNGGGEYKVWVSKNPLFPSNESKTDNFKVKEQPQPPRATLAVIKFYDANANGIKDPTDVELTNWKINIQSGSFNIDRFTPVLIILDPADYTVSEYQPIETGWQPTKATSQNMTLADQDQGSISFGNVCLGAGGGLTLGFWSNKNGQALVDASDLAALGVLNLRDAGGNHWPGANPLAPTYAAYRTWVLAANATNMAYMLSAQLSAMKLNVLNTKVNGGAIIYAPGTTSANPFGFATVNAIMGEADTSLGAFGYTISGNAERAHQEALKNALDKANNNLNFAQATPCAYSFN